jgi:hypothetical protein
MLRSMPFALLEHQRLALARLDQRGRSIHSMRRRPPRRRLAREHRGAGAVAEQAGADQHAGIVVEVHRRRC